MQEAVGEHPCLDVRIEVDGLAAPRERERVEPLDVDVAEMAVADALGAHHVRDQMRDEAGR